MLIEFAVNQDYITLLLFSCRDIPAHKQTIAGKNLPIEKFAILKSERFIKGSRLPLAIPVS